MLKMRPPSSIPWPSTSSENVIVATPFGPNHDMNQRSAAEVSVPASDACTATGRATNSVNSAIADRGQPVVEQPVRR